MKTYLPYPFDEATGKTKLKSLFDIFSQLKANDASIQDLTRLFDKIGGNAANNVFAELMKLPELIQNSVYAAGLSDRIASEKQETIKGKWDKVTSQFTETGMNVFEAYSPVIKEGLDNLVLLLQQSGTAKMLKDIASGLIAITEGLINVSTWVSKNWYWLEHFVVGGVLLKKISNIVAYITSMTKGLLDTAKATGVLTTAKRRIRSDRWRWFVSGYRRNTRHSHSGSYRPSVFRNKHVWSRENDTIRKQGYRERIREPIANIQG